ncbi:unnamed protein product [Cuscuta campestris]|uniref:MLO-like protein n=1 Tax=Cuscuta campestris TaxID=132261 RepID=A0A484NQD0_9ASTE|nr:unnamed protein product [Cuscuta campestris]
MAIYLWSRWEIKGASCFTQKGGFLVTRLAFGVASQIWCSFITFPLYVIIAQMGSEFKKSIISESVESSLQRWRCRVQVAAGTRRLLLVEDHNTNSDQIPLTEEITSANDDDDDDDEVSSWRRRSLEQEQMRAWAGP